MTSLFWTRQRRTGPHNGHPKTMIYKGKMPSLPWSSRQPYISLLKKISVNCESHTHFPDAHPTYLEFAKRNSSISFFRPRMIYRGLPANTTSGSDDFHAQVHRRYSPSTSSQNPQGHEKGSSKGPRQLLHSQFIPNILPGIHIHDPFPSKVRLRKLYRHKAC